MEKTHVPLVKALFAWRKRKVGHMKLLHGFLVGWDKPHKSLCLWTNFKH
uniref:Uncharacterized protein n=1 Tax=Arundo donax TaxID=35708 RepID=A0A0A9BBM1_ARUDO